MVKPTNKPYFETVWKYVTQFDTTVGFFLFRDSVKKKTLVEKFFRSTWLRHAVLFVSLVTSTLITTDFQLISIILSTSLSTNIIAIYSGLMMFLVKEDVTKDLLDRCRSLYDVKRKYHERIQKLAETQLVLIETRATKLLKGFRITMYVDCFVITMGIAIIGIFLPDNIYPKFSPPLPFYLPFKDQNTWLAFITNVLHQTMMGIDSATLTVYVIGIMICIYVHILGYLDIIQKATELMKREIISVKEQEPTFKSTLQLETLAIINANSVKDQSPSLTFNEWAQIINEMICDVNTFISSFKKQLSVPFLFTEIASLGSLFICGLLFTVVHEQHFFAVGITIGCCILFFDCYVNEQILEKLQNIKRTLYDMPWFKFDPKQRKTLMMLMHCDKIQRGFTVGEIHDLTLERFWIVFTAGYKYLLILKDLVQK